MRNLNDVLDRWLRSMLRCSRWDCAADNGGRWIYGKLTLIKSRFKRFVRSRHSMNSTSSSSSIECHPCASDGQWNEHKIWLKYGNWIHWPRYFRTLDDTTKRERKRTHNSGGWQNHRNYHHHHIDINSVAYALIAQQHVDQRRKSELKLASESTNGRIPGRIFHLTSKFSSLYFLLMSGNSAAAQWLCVVEQFCVVCALHGAIESDEMWIFHSHSTHFHQFDLASTSLLSFFFHAQRSLLQNIEWNSQELEGWKVGLFYERVVKISELNSIDSGNI